MGEGWGEGDRGALPAIGPGFWLRLATPLSRKEIAGKKKYAFGSFKCTSQPLSSVSHERPCANASQVQTFFMQKIREQMRYLNGVDVGEHKMGITVNTN
jgi:hypothetical protein